MLEVWYSPANRELSEDEINAIKEKEFNIGDDYDKRAILSSTRTISVSEKEL